MPAKKFPKSVAESLLVKSHRRCCICHDYCGNKMEIHHIDPNGGNEEDNGIPLCFNCHAEVGSYNPAHPKGRKFSQSELKKHKVQWFKQAASLTFIEDISPSSEKFIDEYPPGAKFLNFVSYLVEIYSKWRYDNQKISLFKEKILLGVLSIISFLPIFYSLYFNTSFLQNQPVLVLMATLFGLLLFIFLVTIEQSRCKVCNDIGGIQIFKSKLIDEKIRENEETVKTDKTYDVYYKCKSCGTIMNKIERHQFLNYKE